MKRLKIFIILSFLVSGANSKLDSLALYLSILNYHNNYKLNKLEDLEDEFIMENENDIKNERNNTNFSNSFLLIINSILILISISLFYVATIFYYKAKLDLAYYFDEIDLLDKESNCVFSYGKKNLEGKYISYYKSCDENMNGVVDTTYFMDADKEVYTVDYDLNEDGIIEYSVIFDKFKREVTKCYYSENGISVKSCLTTNEDDSKNIYERFLDKGSLIETNEYLDSEGKRIIKISNFGKQGIKIEN